nr:variable large family protein [Borrelia persica]
MRGGIGKMGEVIKRSLIIIMIILGMMGCNSGLVAEKEGLEKKNSFLNSLVKIGQGFQDIFGVFRNAIGDALGLIAVKSGDKKSEVGKHFEKIKKGLEVTNGKLKELAGGISGARDANEVTIKVVEDSIKVANDVFERLIVALTKLAGVTNDSADIGDTASASAAVAAEKAGVDSIIAEVKNIIEIAEKSGVKIEAGTAGTVVNNGDDTAGAALAKSGAAPAAGAGPKLADEVSKADPWAMIDKIKNAKTGVELVANNNNEAGALATKIAEHANTGAKSNADLAAAVALKAMTKSGKLSAAANEVVGVKAAGVSAVNKVLGILDVIIKKTVANNLEKVREVFQGIKYSETSGNEASQSDTTQTPATK